MRRPPCRWHHPREKLGTREAPIWRRVLQQRFHSIGTAHCREGAQAVRHMPFLDVLASSTPTG